MELAAPVAAQVGALQRIDGDVDGGIFQAGRRRGAHPLADIQHGSFVALAFADHDVSGDGHIFKGAAHGLHGGMIGAGAVALSHGAGGRDGGFLHHARHLERQVRR